MAESSKTSRWTEILVAFITAVGSFAGGWASKDHEISEKNDETNKNTLKCKDEYIVISEKYDSISFQNGMLSRQSQQYALALKKCQDSFRAPVSTEKGIKLPPKALKNLLIEPTGGLSGKRLDGTIVFEFRVSTDEQEETAALNIQNTSIVGDDGNFYRAVYAEIGGKNTIDNNNYSTLVGVLYRSAPLKAEYRFQLPTTVTKASALSIDVDGKRVLYSDVIIRWH